MSDRYYSDLDEDDYFNEPECDIDAFEAINNEKYDESNKKDNPRKNVISAINKRDYVENLKKLLPRSSDKPESNENTNGTSETKKTNKMIVVEKYGHSDNEDNYDRRSTKIHLEKSVNDKIVAEENMVRARLDKVIQKRQERLQLLERQINVMSVYQNIRFFIRVLCIKKVKSFVDKYFFTNSLDAYIEILSIFNVNKYVDDFKIITMEEKLDTILTLMVQSKTNEITKKYSNTQIFLVLLNLFGIKHWLNYYLTYENIDLKKRFKLRTGREKDLKKPVKKVKLKKVMNSIDLQMSTIVNSIITELNECNVHLQISDGISEYQYPKFTDNNKESIVTGLKGKFFFGILRFEKQSHNDNISISHVTVLELDEEIWVQTLMSIQAIGLKNTIDDIAHQNKNLSIREQKLILALRKSRIPQSNYEFRINEFYAIKSVLKRGEIFKDEAKPTGYTFMDQPVYNRSDVLELYGKIRWKMKGRQVRSDEKPIKTMPNIYRTDQLMDLYAEWQTDPFVLEIKNGKLPENEFGNIELFGCPLPKELVHLDYKGIWKACKELDVDYKQAVTGFDIRKGRNFAVKSGVVIFKKDENKVMECWEVMAKAIEAKEESKRIEITIKHWRTIFKCLLVKKYMKTNYK